MISKNIFKIFGLMYIPRRKNLYGGPPFFKKEGGRSDYKALWRIMGKTLWKTSRGENHGEKTLWSIREKTLWSIIRVWLMSQKEPRFEPHPLEP